MDSNECDCFEFPFRQTCCVLDFDTMDLDDLSEYDAVRRLTNSESIEKNPHFPSRSKIYWCEGINYKEYSAVTFALFV